MFAGSVRRAFLKAVAHGGDIPKLHDLKLGLGWRAAEERVLKDPLMAPAFDIAEAGDLKTTLGQIRGGV